MSYPNGLEYIKRRIEAGESQQQIVQALFDAGWTMPQIRAAFDEFKPIDEPQFVAQRPQITNKTRKKPIAIIAVLLLAPIALVASGIFLTDHFSPSDENQQNLSPIVPDRKHGTTQLPDPNELLNQAIISLKKKEWSFAFTGEYAFSISPSIVQLIELSGQSPFPSDIAIAKISGTFDGTDPEAKQVLMDLVIKDGSVFDMQTRLLRIGNNNYANTAKFPAMAQVDLSSIKNDWVNLTPEFIHGEDATDILSGFGLPQADLWLARDAVLARKLDQYIDLLADPKLITTAQQQPDDRINDQTVTYFRISYDEHKFRQKINEIFDDDIAAIPPGPRSAVIHEQTFFAHMVIKELNIWISESDQRVYRIAADFVRPQITLGYEGGPARIDIIFDKHTQAHPVSLPNSTIYTIDQISQRLSTQHEQNYEDYLQGQSSENTTHNQLLSARATAIDRARSETIDNLRFKIIIGFDSASSYADFCQSNDYQAVLTDKLPEGVQPTCQTTASTYLFTIPLDLGGYYCADQTGFAGGIATLSHGSLCQ